MSYRIYTNIASMNALRHADIATEKLDKAATRLNSGERINRAADDAAGLAISDRMAAKVRSAAVAWRNAQDAYSVMEVAEGGFEETSRILTRLRRLAVQAGSDTVGLGERSYLDREFVTMKYEIDRIAASVEFNGVRLLSGMPTPPAGHAMADLKSRDLDYPIEFQIDTDYYPGVDGPKSRNTVNTLRFSTKNLVAFTSGRHSLGLGEGHDGARLNSKIAAYRALAQIDGAITQVNRHRAFLGSSQSQLKHSMKVLRIRHENMESSRSRIRDADFARATAQYVSANLRKEASTGILTAANQSPAGALSLIGRPDPEINIIRQSIIAREL